MPTSNVKLARRVAGRLIACPGMRAIVIGGSLATAIADPESDIDLGLYYDPLEPIDLRCLSRLVAEIDDRHDDCLVTDFGAWGPWVNGGGWLLVEGHRVDLLYRDLHLARRAIDACRAGDVRTDFQVGHPAGYTPVIYAGEIDSCVPTHDPNERVARLKEMTRPYPPRLRLALVDGLREADFCLELAIKGARRGDVYYVAGCAFRATACMVQALFGLNHRYWTNEKGMLRIAAHLELRPPRLRERIAGCLGNLGTDAAGLLGSLDELGIHAGRGSRSR